MIVLELSEVEIDHCVSCGGTWFDAGELELLLGNAKEKDSFLSSLTAARPKPERQPWKARTPAPDHPWKRHQRTQKRAYTQKTTT